MTNLYRLQARLKKPRHYVYFSPGLQDKLDDLIWGHPNRNPIDLRWKIQGKAQDDLSDRLLQQLDYIPGISALDFFSQRFLEHQPPELVDDVDFIPCAVVSKTDQEHPFFLARCHRFVDVVDAVATGAAESISALAPMIFKDEAPSFLMARDGGRRTISVVSERFKSYCEKHDFQIDFRPVDTGLTNWMSRQGKTAP